LAQNNERRFVENDRRLARIEMVVNKTFILVRDITNSNTSMELTEDTIENPHGFETPKLPVESLRELAILQSKLKNKEFRKFLVKLYSLMCTF